MGIFEYLLKGLGPEARRKLAKEAARSAIERAGEAVYDKADSLREEIEDSARRRREQQDRARARVAAERAEARDEREIEDELAALRTQIEREER